MAYWEVVEALEGQLSEFVLRAISNHRKGKSNL
ncbi:hypothetical protein SCAZ3_06240 [Streptococcus canis FSL Z3-227]|uniref:Uncharacterized protein n=1 Tax=Streptococcus canis FSL Z3-227 TaxID=482234 RepID=A0AAV3FTB3_STRCB|nr:hypothetical protein SCAZ3_06240 [Streptococcus canis FSL Z3-227]